MNEKQKPVIFLAFANDRGEARDGYLRELLQEERGIRNALEKAEADGACELVVRSDVKLEDIFKIFQSRRYRNRIAIFHYGGHANSYQLLLESAKGEVEAIYAKDLAAFLGRQDSLHLVFLNGCSTKEQAKNLIEAGVPAVIATSQAIDDCVARDLATRFYEGFAQNLSVKDAYEEAADYIRARKGEAAKTYRDLKLAGSMSDRWPWELCLEGDREDALEALTWNLAQAANDPLFFLPPVPPGKLTPKPFRHLEWFAREHAEIFFGRGYQIRELYERVTAEDSEPIILLYGQAGVGKSSILAAGLMPRLEASHEVRYERRDEHIGLSATLKRALGPEGETPLQEAWHTLEAKFDRPVVVILDQLEEVFTRPNDAYPKELETFLADLTAIFAEGEAQPKGSC